LISFPTRRSSDLQAESVEDRLVGGTVFVVGGLQSFVVDVEGVGVLHVELTSAQYPGPGAGLVAELLLDLVQGDREVLVGGVLPLDQEREEFLMGGAEQVVGPLAVLEPEQ